MAYGAYIAHTQVGAAREFGEAFDTGNRRSAVFVRERDQKRVVLFIGSAYISLFREHIGDGKLHFRKRHRYRSLPHAGSVLDAYEQVCDRVVYHEDFLTPGIRPSLAASRKQARHIPKSRMKARLRPHLKQRRTTRDLNFGGLFERATVDFFAIWL